MHQQSSTNPEQRALETLQAWAKRNAWAAKVAALKTRQLLNGGRR